MSANDAKPVIECQGLDKSFVDGERSLVILAGLDLAILPGERIAIVGRSGSGKTTLLHIIAGLEPLTSGHVLFDGEDISKFNDATRNRYRMHGIGLVFQFHFLLPDFTACENAAMPLLSAGLGQAKAMAQARQMLKRMDLEDRADHLPSALSGGERQRVAIARALINQPRLVIADEPTGNLDSATAETMVTLLLEQAAAAGSALLVATHDANIAKRVDRCFELSRDGLMPH